MNSLGNALKLSTFGESHGAAIGGILDGMPAGVRLDLDDIRLQLARRRPGATSLTTSRNERDEVSFLSGLLDGVTTGAPIAFVIANNDARPEDYEAIKALYRPGHADFTYEARYTGIRDWRGGGRSSARWTAAVVVAGAIAGQWLVPRGIRIAAYTSAIGRFRLPDMGSYMPSPEAIYSTDVRCPMPIPAAAMAELIKRARAVGDSVGGVVSCRIRGVPAGIGSPMFDKLSSRLAAAIFSINAVKGFDIGDGFAMSRVRGSEVVDEWEPAIGDARGMRTKTNHSGGIQGGISNGEDITFRVAFKPTPTLSRPLLTVDRDRRPVIFKGLGRHDPCVVPRAVPVVATLTAFVIADALLEARGYNPAIVL